MKIGYNWLKSYVNIDCDLSTLCEKLTMAGIEVEGIEAAAGVPAGVVVAKIMERKPHPDRDHMSVCQVFDGKETIQVVCGAPNCDAGKVVPLAKIGTVFNTPEGSFKIKRSKLRGVESCGMMCAADEIGVPLAITVDFDTLEDNQVTVRDRDSEAQERIAIDELKEYLEKYYK